MIKETENDWISSTIHEFERVEEGLTGLLLGGGGSLGLSFSADKNETAGESSGGGGGECNDYYEDNKNYLESIFSFVDPSPSDSTPMFWIKGRYLSGNVFDSFSFYFILDLIRFLHFYLKLLFNYYYY